MTEGVLVDSNVLIDVGTQDPVWQDWSWRQLATAMEAGPVYINPIIYAELAAYANSEDELKQALAEFLLERADLPWEAAFLTSKAFVGYRQRGGSKTSPLPDFYIGAHAQVAGLTLLTRDAGRYRTYFPKLRLIAPDTAT